MVQQSGKQSIRKKRDLEKKVDSCSMEAIDEVFPVDNIL